MVEAISVLAVMGIIFGLVLTIAAKKFEIKTDPNLDAIKNLLPGANCGACGFPGCSSLAEAIFTKDIPASKCLVAKNDAITAINDILGKKADIIIAKFPYLKCQHAPAKAEKTYKYNGLSDCSLVLTLFKGNRICKYSCFGMGSCVKACPFQAISIAENGFPQIDVNLCTGCGICVEACPQSILELSSENQTSHIKCNNLDRGKQALDVCETSCVSCGICIKKCPEEAISMKTYKNSGTLPKIDETKCTQCNICIQVCPRKCITYNAPIQRNTFKSSQKAGCSACSLCS